MSGHLLLHHDSDAHCSPKPQDPALTSLGDCHSLAWLQVSKALDTDRQLFFSLPYFSSTLQCYACLSAAAGLQKTGIFMLCSPHHHHFIFHPPDVIFTYCSTWLRAKSVLHQGEWQNDSICARTTCAYRTHSCISSYTKSRPT